MKAFFVLFLVVLISCTDRGDESRTYNLILENHSGKDITIDSYDPSSREILTSINITDNEFRKYIFKSRDSDGPYTLRDVFEAGSFRKDSIVVRYSDGKKNIFVCDIETQEGCAEDRNPLAYLAPEVIGDQYTITYVFTVDDHEDAND